MAAGRAGRWADLRLRIASAAVLAPIAIASIWFGGLAWTLLLIVVVAGSGYEWLAMCGRSLPQRGAARAAGLAYIALAGVALYWLRSDEIVGRVNTVLVVSIVWASDIGAYMAGRWLGGPKLAPAISPGKTQSGAAGGLAAAVLVGVAVWALVPGGSAGAAVMVTALLGVASQAGDLLESAAKRWCGVKDSGWLIPGHGGLLDRLDGLMAAAPVAAGVAVLVGRGAYLWR